MHLVVRFIFITQWETHPTLSSQFNFILSIVDGGAHFYYSPLLTDSSLERFHQLTYDDWLWLVLLATVCTAYATIASVNILKHVTPFTMMISLNLEPVYGIVFSLLIFGEKELMSVQFYVGVVVILGGVIGNGIYKRQREKVLSAHKNFYL